MLLHKVVRAIYGRFLLILIVALTALCSEDEERLVRDLFRDYNKLIRPVEAMNDTVEVQFGLSFIQLINVSWYDYQLRWDEAEYGGIAVVRLPPDKVWKPDIVLFNNADGNYEVRYKSNVLIYPSGTVTWIPPAIYQSSCTIDVTYFPFDQQKCVMKFGSWTFNGDQVTLKLYGDNHWVDLSDYWKSGTWDIVEVPAFLNVYNGTKNGKPTETDISFYITIRRKTLFYTVNLILPTLLISFLCILVFYLPAEAGEKVTLGISILLSLVVFLLLVSKILPPTSLVLPLIAKYLLFTFLMNCISILATVIIINWNFRGPRTHKMPNWVRLVFLKYLPVLLLIRRPKKTRLRWMMDMPSLGGHYHPYQSSTANNAGPGLGGQPGDNSCGPGTPPMTGHEHAPVLDHHLHHHHHSHSPPFPPPPPPCDKDMGDFGDPLVSSTVGGLGGHHHANCTIPGHNGPDHQLHQRLGLGVHNASYEQQESQLPKQDSDSVDTLYLTPEAYRATEAIEFIAEHLRSEDEYIQIREDWKYVAMVIDRLQLYIFFIVTAAGTIAILLDAPHIFEYVDQDKVIEIHKGKST
ncbi:Acetylcholine receptor subunit beta-like 1 [Halotydeus destructor]|nr:Acetylcholine receptor subunit beta-like 1 [Halotydeus destructor]